MLHCCIYYNGQKEQRIDKVYQVKYTEVFFSPKLDATMPIMTLFYLPDWMAPTLSSVRFPNVCQSFLSRQKVKDSCCRCPPLTPLTPLTPLDFVSLQ